MKTDITLAAHGSVFRLQRHRSGGYVQPSERNPAAHVAMPVHAYWSVSHNGRRVDTALTLGSAKRKAEREGLRLLGGQTVEPWKAVRFPYSFT